MGITSHVGDSDSSRRDNITAEFKRITGRLIALEARMDTLLNEMAAMQTRNASEATSPEPREAEAPKEREAWLRVTVNNENHLTHKADITYKNCNGEDRGSIVDPADLVESPPDKTWAGSFYAVSAKAAKWKGLCKEAIEARRMLRLSWVLDNIEAALDEDKA